MLLLLIYRVILINELYVQLFGHPQASLVAVAIDITMIL
jgi:hypothetical protein